MNVNPVELFNKLFFNGTLHCDFLRGYYSTILLMLLPSNKWFYIWIYSINENKTSSLGIFIENLI